MQLITIYIRSSRTRLPYLYFCCFHLKIHAVYSIQYSKYGILFKIITYFLFKFNKKRSRINIRYKVIIFCFVRRTIMTVLKAIARKYNDTSLIIRIVIGLIIGAALGVAFKNLAAISILGDLFVGALKAIAPVLVFVIVIAALCQGSSKLDRRFGTVIVLYLVGTSMGGVVAVIGSFMFPQTIKFAKAYHADSVVHGFGQIVHNLLMNIVDNPVNALVNANYLGILAWAVIFGLALKRFAAPNSQRFMKDLSDAVQQGVRWVINFAPFGIMGIVYTNVSTNGLSIFTTYGKLLLLLVGCMLTAALIVNPLIEFIVLRRNPYPLLWRCIKGSAITAFFTRSSAANIPVNMGLCKRLGLDEDMYSVSIPLGSTINMNGASVTISVMTMACAHTLGINVDLPSAIVLCILSAFAACGASGVAGGSLLLIPMACSLFGISNEIAMQVVAVGFIVGVVQDALETALNSSGDVLWTATAEYLSCKRKGKSLPTFMSGTTVVEESNIRKHNYTQNSDEK